MMSLRRYVLRSWTYHWRINLAVACGVAAATAVLTGALLVGDSVRGSLRALTIERLGKIDELLVADRFFRTELASELAAGAGFEEHFSAAVPAIIFPAGTVQFPNDDGQTAVAGGVLVVGATGEFWELGAAVGRPPQPPARDEIVLNQPLAEELGVQVGDEVILRLPKGDQVPAETPLGEKAGRISGISELKVTAIIPARGLGRFSLRASQTAPRNAYVHLETLQGPLEQKGKVNSILVAGHNANAYPSPAGSKLLKKLFRPRLSDFGFMLSRKTLTFPDPDAPAPTPDAKPDVVYDYWSLTSDRMLIEPGAERAARDVLGIYSAEPVLTYLANGIGKVSDAPAPTAADEIPYSTIAALPSRGGRLGPHILDEAGRPITLGTDGVALTNWAAKDLDAKVGDKIRLTFFEPETTHGEYRERTVELVVKAIVPLVEPAKPGVDGEPPMFTQRPTPANDPNLTPEVPGVSDQESIDDWDLPFAMTRPIRSQDDLYWNRHRTTPKAYVSLELGQKLWGSRFGNVTSFRIPNDGEVDEETLSDEFLEELREQGVNLGMLFQPIKRKSLDASAGATPFDVLFLSLSFFIIAAALMLVWLLFRLGIEQRAGEIGTLLALGMKRRTVSWLMIQEGTLVAAVGGLIGVVVGTGYAWLMLTGLRTRWVGAIVTPFLEFHVGPLSLIGGYLIGVLVCVITIMVSIRGLRKLTNRELLAGQAVVYRPVTARSGFLSLIVAVILFVAAVGLAVAARQLGGEAQAGAFVGAGAAVLTALLLLAWRQLRVRGRTQSGRGIGGVFRLALRSAGRNPGRSVLTIGLIGTASFLIVAMSSFRLDPTPAGMGGFNLVAQSAQPVFPDLNSATGREELLGDEATAKLAGTTILPLRLKPGDDASCNNLYQATQPRVLGVTDAMVEHFDQGAHDGIAFEWAGTAATTDEDRANPWRLLKRSATRPADAPVPVVVDKNTAMYSLKLYGGVGQVFDLTYESGTTISFQVVGLLSNSILQGSLLVGQADFEQLFADVDGYRYFLIRTPLDSAEVVRDTLEDQLSDQGFDVRSAHQLLAGLLAVQNTYLETFQSLGALGLLLGTFGLATVQLRSVLERRGELALMRATGFRRGRLAWIVMVENGLLLFAGLLIGVVAALVAVLPHLVWGEASIPRSLQLDLGLFLAAVLAIGLAAGLVAVQAVLRAPLLAALRRD